MAEYTYENIIMDPTLEKTKNAVGKECYMDFSPQRVLFLANNGLTSSRLSKIVKGSSCPFFSEELGVSYPLIIVKKGDTYIERAKKWVEENNLKADDYVKVLRKAESHEHGWNAEWVREMDDCVGKTLKVLEINLIHDFICLEYNDAAYSFPYFVLEKVEPPKPKYVPFKSVEEFLDGYYKSETERVKDGLEHYLSTRGIWIRYKVTGFLYQITMLGTTTVIVNTDQLTDFKELLEKYEFLDGSPCGKLTEESNA